MANEPIEGKSVYVGFRLRRELRERAARAAQESNAESLGEWVRHAIVAALERHEKRAATGQAPVLPTGRPKIAGL